MNGKNRQGSFLFCFGHVVRILDYIFDTPRPLVEERGTEEIQQYVDYNITLRRWQSKKILDDR